MIDAIEQHRGQIGDLCRRFEVERLELFGSGADGRFDPARSDLDFLVAFQVKGGVPADDRQFGLMEGLEAVLGRKVDLVDIRAARNPYFVAGALQHRVTIYAA